MIVVEPSGVSEVLRVAVAVFGWVLIGVCCWVLALQNTRRDRVPAAVLAVFVMLTALGISLNYTLHIPVVTPGAYFYLSAYVFVGGVFMWGMRHRPALLTGEPGRPGEPGEPGVGGGGVNGHGWKSLRYALVGIGVVLVVLMAYSITTVHRVDVNSAKLTAAQKKAEAAAVSAAKTLVRLDAVAHKQQMQLVALREIDYRLCYRQMVTRAALNLHVMQDPRDGVPILPLYDCTPDLHGGVARRLPPAKTRAFERLVERATNLP